MAQIRTDAITQEHALGRLAAASPLVRRTDGEQVEDESRDGGETPESEEADRAD